MRQVLRAGALGRPRGMGWGGRRERGSGWGTHINPWLIHVNVWQKPLQYCKVLGLQLIKISEKKKKELGRRLDEQSEKLAEIMQRQRQEQGSNQHLEFLAQWSGRLQSTAHPPQGSWVPQAWTVTLRTRSEERLGPDHSLWQPCGQQNSLRAGSSSREAGEPSAHGPLPTLTSAFPGPLFQKLQQGFFPGPPGAR